MSKIRTARAGRLGVLVAVAMAAIPLAGPVFAQTVTDPVQAEATALRDRFVAAIKACGVTPTFEPGVIVETHPGLVAYFNDDRSAHLSRWAEVDPSFQGMVEAWGAAGPLGLDGEHQFSEIFNSLLLPHELGHFLQHQSGRFETLDHWEAEVEANRIAIAFWSLDPADAARLPARIENFTGFLGKLPDPVPEGSTPRDYFNANYRQLGADAQAYGWYQGAFMRTAWAERNQNDFCALVRLNSPH